MSTDTLRHQLLYEVHDPTRYLSPDVVADFTSAHFEDLPDDGCASPTCAARPRPTRTSCCSRTHAGWSGEARVAFSWPDAYEKAKATAAILAKRVEMAGLDGRRVAHRVLGRRRARRADRAAPATAADARAARVRAARRVAVRRPAHRRTRRARARAAHALGAARGHDRRGRRRRGGATELLGDLADARRQGARRRARCAS